MLTARGVSPFSCSWLDHLNVEDNQEQSFIGLWQCLVMLLASWVVPRHHLMVLDCVTRRVLSWVMFECSHSPCGHERGTHIPLCSRLSRLDGGRWPNAESPKRGGASASSWPLLESNAFDAVIVRGFSLCVTKIQVTYSYSPLKEVSVSRYKSWLRPLWFFLFNLCLRTILVVVRPLDICGWCRFLGRSLVFGSFCSAACSSAWWDLLRFGWTSPRISRRFGDIVYSGNISLSFVLQML